MRKSLFLYSFLIFLEVIRSQEEVCRTRIEISKTAEIVRKIIEKAAIVKREASFENYLIFGNTVELDGVEYYLNTNKHSPDLSFFFELPRFTSKLVYILPEQQKLEEWSPKFPDNTKLLGKISRNCESGRLCGLECCPKNVKIITDLLYNSDRIVRFKNVTYSRKSELLSKNFEKICEFQNDRQPKMYFGCLKNQECCSLTCQNRPIALAVVSLQNHREKLSLWEKIKFPLLTCSLFILFVLITVINSKLHNRARSSSSLSSPQLRNPGRILISSDSEKSQLTVTTLLSSSQMSKNEQQQQLV